MDLQTATPAEIDEALAAIYTRYYQALSVAMEAGRRAERAAQSRYFSAEGVAAAEAKAIALHCAAVEILREASPYDAEFDRRGGWTRAFLVDNTGGHVHSSTACSTCFSTTQFVWLPQYSGGTEERIVEDAGEMACTVCYPSAPVDVLRRASRIETSERRARRLEREQRAAVKAAKAITMPDGSPLKKDGWQIGTVISARNEAAKSLIDDAWYEFKHPTRGEWLAYLDRAVEALAAKEGRDAAEVRAEIVAKAAKRIARDDRDKARARG